MTGGIASCCECEECSAIELLAFLCLRPELAKLLASCNIDPCRDIYRIVSNKRRSDPDGFKRILWAWPLCGSDVDFSPQKPQHLSGQDYAWLSKEAPALYYRWDPDSQQTLETAEPNICAWLFVSRLNPSLKATAETFVKEYFMEPCCNCRCGTRLTFFPKRKSWVHKEIAGRVCSTNSALKGHRLKASFCARCHENYSLWVPDKPPFFNPGAVRKLYREWRKQMGIFGRQPPDFGDY